MATRTRPARSANNIDAMNAKYGKNQLPAGYTAVSSMGTKWDYLNQPVLIGTVDALGVRVIETPDPDNKGKMRLSQIVSIIEEDTGVVHDVWESASLTDWFARCHPGAEVAVVFQGLRPPKPGRSPMKVFVGSFKGEPPPVRDDALGQDGAAPAAKKPAAKKRPARRA